MSEATRMFVASLILFCRISTSPQAPSKKGEKGKTRDNCFLSAIYARRFSIASSSDISSLGILLPNFEK